ncbi:MAG: 5-formyltetrahydrofolate cyclo-ligase [Oscillospiraceae bacterium]|nr:5-formyltetrahydrofolate cyclo-ligase [Oscillospiraceae bacterium]
MNEPDEKAELRRRLRDELASCSVSALSERNALLTKRFLQLSQVRQAKTILLFCGVGSEPDTRLLTEGLWDMGKRVAMPVCLPHRQMEARELTSWEELIPGKFGIQQPGGNCPVLLKEEIDLILVPALACDKEGYRLGQGAGYYDRYLSDYRGMTVALCGKRALLERLPRQAHDLPVSIIVTDEDAPE